MTIRHVRIVNTMPIAVGDKLGPYEILASIGKGGMGEVFKARDTRLNRDVAIKVSAAQFTERFEREARAVAALNHPNICQIYDIVVSRDAPNYLVMEFVEGDAPKGPLSLETALNYARQMADALEEAHGKNIVHRDLKPANIKIKADGTVKVLDFGLAKFTPAEAGATPSEDSLTLSMAATQMGVILGTAGYMSPEQARGKPVDKRADIWAFGVVLYEMLTGRRLFQGEDVSHTMAAVIMQEPKLDDVPVQVRKLLQRCLEKDPKKRLRDIADAMGMVEEQSGTGLQPVSAQAKGLSHWVWPAVAAVMALALALISFLHFRETPQEVPVLRATILPPPNTELNFAQGRGLLALSPDGRKIVFGARAADGKSPLWVRPLDGLTAQALAGTEGATFPFWSPDSRSIAFFADGKLKKIDAGGGAAITLADVPVGRGGSWGQDDVIIFGVNPIAEIQRISSAGGAATPVGKERGRMPWFLPDGQHFLFEVQRNNGGPVSIHIGALDGSPSKELKNLGNVTTAAIYAQGRLLYLREGTLMAQPFDTKRLETTGEAVPVAEQVESTLNSATVGVFSVSQTGLLAFRTGAQRAAGGGRQLTWFDRQGKMSAASEAGQYDAPVLSPDGTQVAFTQTDAQAANATTDIWLHEFARGTSARFTSDPAPDAAPVWSPDGASIVFRSNRDGVNLFKKTSTGAGMEELLLKSPEPKSPDDWSRDGRFLLFNVIAPKTSNDIWYLPMGGASPAQPQPYLQTTFQEAEARFSPDGRFVAYTSNESGTVEVYVRTFPDPKVGKWTVSKGGGELPRWRKDGKELFYLARAAPARNVSTNLIGPAKLMAVDIAVSASGSFKAGVPKFLFQFPGGPAVYDVTGDG
jgi:Tol biopolymer transport system component/tRNA A-37 threonylcarbamoyl transferase component Bud32